MIEKLVRPEIKNFIPYNANQIPHRVKLDANESPFDLPQSVKAKLAEYFMKSPELNLYPDTDSIELRKALAVYWKANFNGIVVGTGSDQIIQSLINVFVGKNDKILCPTPSFSMYKLTTIIAGGIPIEFILDKENGYKYDPDEIIGLARIEKPKIVFLCTPNNPTGNIIPIQDIIKIVEGCNQSVVVIDEAYAEFSEETAVSLTTMYENVVILRTFSKAYGLAGIRCGYSISSVEMANEINKVKPPYNISSLSQFIARLVFEERDEINRQIENIVKEREYLIDRLKALDRVIVHPSSANFILVRIPNSKSVNDELIKRGVLVRNFGSAPMLEDCVRITVGNREQNNILLEELMAILNSK